jgi:hypothetical protein
MFLFQVGVQTWLVLLIMLLADLCVKYPRPQGLRDRTDMFAPGLDCLWVMWGDAVQPLEDTKARTSIGSAKMRAQCENIQKK